VASRVKLPPWRECRGRPGVVLAPGRLLIAALVIVAGCSQASAGNGQGSNTAEYSTQDAPRQAPYIDATPAPAGPPTVELLGEVDGKPVPGVLYTADWPIRAAQVRKRPRRPVPWPAAAHVGSPGSVILRFHARTPPDRVLMKTFSQLDPATGEPASDPAASYQCSRSSDPRCSFEHARSAVRLLGLPPGVLARGFLVVFCTWSVPPEQQAEHGGAEAAASWLFRIG
jgi:hypothetical protein